jgi:SAM-dependent methyltransferase
MADRQFIPALGFSWLTRFYDPVVALTCRERRFRNRLLDQADLQPHARVLDVACGTATFALLVKQRFPDCEVAGLDGDAGILRLAQRKAARAGVDVTFTHGLSNAMPYADASFDAVFASLFFHHLDTGEKLRTLQEVMRVLIPGGGFHICDWGAGSTRYARAAFTTVRLLDGFDVTRDNAEGRLPTLMHAAGFHLIHETGRVETILGTLQLLAAQRSGTGNALGGLAETEA